MKNKLSMKGNYQVSQNLDLIPHQTGKAYTISVKEWNFLKGRIQQLKIEINNFYWIGYSLLGASFSSFITVLVTNFGEDVGAKYILWSLFSLTLITGSLSLYFSNDKHKEESSKPSEIISQMQLIESKFEQNQV
jgi:hypothetical protein